MLTFKKRRTYLQPVSKIQLGCVPDSDAKRDAVHVAIAPVEAGEQLMPGQRVCVRHGLAYGEKSADGHATIGIVDPFLATPVKCSHWFWLLLDPSTVKNLRHDWDHDNIPQPGSAEAEVDDGCRGC